MRRLVLLLALAAGPAHAQAVRLHVLADSVFVGERFSLAVSVDHLDGTTVAFPEVPAGDPEAGPLLAFGDAEILSMRRLPPRLDDRARTDSVVYEAATFALDSALVGPVTVRLSSARDTTTLVSPVVPLRVRSTVPTGTQEPRPPAPPDPFPVAIGPWLLLGLLAAALVVLAVFLWRKRQDRMPP
ncbi:MAG TPA: hypothetical protein VD962_03875, partial [Rubricoccaceae bacterium]|nr:hypothetical protein [Rubricoccaceae bacterium]